MQRGPGGPLGEVDAASERPGRRDGGEGEEGAGGGCGRALEGCFDGLGEVRAGARGVHLCFLRWLCKGSGLFGSERQQGLRGVRCLGGDIYKRADVCFMVVPLSR